MFIELTKSDFRDLFHQMGREEQFSYEALGLLFDYFEGIEEDTGEKIEADVIAICCEYSERDAMEVVAAYGVDTSEIDAGDADALFECVREFLQERTSIVGETVDGFVFADF